MEKSTKLFIHLQLYTIDVIALDNVASEFFGVVLEPTTDENIAVAEFAGDNHEQHAASYEEAIKTFKKIP